MITRCHNPTFLKRTLLKKARRKMRAFRAYRGEFERPIWRLVRINADIVTPTGLVFEAGDFTIARLGRDIPGTPADIADILFGFNLRSGGEVAIHGYEDLEGMP